jgi:phosphoglycerate dehydrogenase-like enzyme
MTLTYFEEGMRLYSFSVEYRKLLNRYRQFEMVSTPHTAEVIVTDLTPVDTNKYKRVKYVVCPCTNTNHIIFRRGVRCFSLRNENKFLKSVTSTAEHTIYLLLSLTKKVDKLTFKRPKKPLIRLSGKTIGIIGYGRIGRQVGMLADALGMRVYIHDKNSYYKDNMYNLLNHSDFITLHTSIKKGQAPVLGDKELNWVRDGAFLINTSRGEPIDEEALITHLPRLGGFATDVLCGEPDPPRFRELKRYSNVIITPHVAGYTQEDFEATFRFCMAKFLKEVF